MKTIFKILFDAYEEKESPESRAAVEAAQPIMDEMERKLTWEEYNRFWDAAMDVGTADEEASFARGFRLGARLMLDVLREE